MTSIVFSQQKYIHRGTQTESRCPQTQPLINQDRVGQIMVSSELTFSGKPRLPSTLVVGNARRIRSSPHELASLPDGGKHTTRIVSFPEVNRRDKLPIIDQVPDQYESIVTVSSSVLRENMAGNRVEDTPIFIPKPTRKWRTSPPRPIPALHGPLSLPYARCPS